MQFVLLLFFYRINIQGYCSRCFGDITPVANPTDQTKKTQKDSMYPYPMYLYPCYKYRSATAQPMSDSLLDVTTSWLDLHVDINDSTPLSSSSLPTSPQPPDEPLSSRVGLMKELSSLSSLSQLPIVILSLIVHYGSNCNHLLIIDNNGDIHAMKSLSFARLPLFTYTIRKGITLTSKEVTTIIPVTGMSTHICYYYL